MRLEKIITIISVSFLSSQHMQSIKLCAKILGTCDAACTLISRGYLALLGYKNKGDELDV